MLFSSISFLYYFLPIVLILYFLCPQSMKNGILLAASLIFYAWGEPKYLVWMCISIGIGYAVGIALEKTQDRNAGKYILFGAVCVHLGMLFYFKYADFLLENIGRWTGVEFSLRQLALPIGISFYTFQLLSYEIDVYRGDVKAQKNLIVLALYIAMFPQLIAGPIVRYTDICEQLSDRVTTYADFCAGGCRFIVGLAKKVLIANCLGELCQIFENSTDMSLLYVWMYAVAFTLQIYYDFSGYSDMAIGLGRIFGFHFMENFDYPYIATSVTDFWRRWHRSLGQWFRDYVYIPLGGNRCTKKRWLLNILVVWLLTGLWHGAAWNFVVWGLYFALFLVIEKMGFLRWLEKHPWLRHLYVMLVVVFGFVLFQASDMKAAVHVLRSMLGFWEYPLVSAEAVYYLKNYGRSFLVAAIGIGPWVKNTCVKLSEKMPMVVGLCSMLLLILSTAYLIDGSFNPFLYFRF